MTEPAERRERNVPYPVGESLVNAATDAAYMAFCRRLGHWNPEFPGQKDALKAALRDAYEISSGLIEAAVLKALAEKLADRMLAASTAVARHPEGTTMRAGAAGQLTGLALVLDDITDMVRERDPYHLTEMGL